MLVLSTLLGVIFWPAVLCWSIASIVNFGFSLRPVRGRNAEVCVSCRVDSCYSGQRAVDSLLAPTGLLWTAESHTTACSVLDVGVRKADLQRQWCAVAHHGGRFDRLEL